MACLNIKQLIKGKSKQKQNQDYIYLQWHYMTSTKTMVQEDIATYDIVDNDNKSEVIKPEVESREEVSTRFSDIRLWLAAQPENVCTEIYCDCCDASDDDLHYSCVEVTSSVPSLTLSTPSSSITTPTCSNYNFTSSFW